MQLKLGRTMVNNSNSQTLKYDAQPVQIHIGIIQDVIKRMAANSSSSKTWCISIVSAVLVIVADKGKPEFAWIALLPTLLFLALDVYYLAFEKGFRESYNSFITKLHNDKIEPKDLYYVQTEGNKLMHFTNALLSFSVWGFYLLLIVLIFLARTVVMGN